MNPCQVSQSPYQDTNRAPHEHDCKASGDTSPLCLIINRIYMTARSNTTTVKGPTHSRLNCAVYLCKKKLHEKLNWMGVGFPEWTAQFSVWKTTAKGSSEACATARRNCAVYSVFRHVWRHTVKLLNLTECIAPVKLSSHICRSIKRCLEILKLLYGIILNGYCINSKIWNGST
jgi:hypothetical protein